MIDDPGKQYFMLGQENLENGNLAGAILNLKTAMSNTKNVFLKYEIYKLLALCYLKNNDVYTGKVFINKAKQAMSGFPVNKTYSTNFIQQLGYELAPIALEGYRIKDYGISSEAELLELGLLNWGVKVAEEKDELYFIRGKYFYNEKDNKKALNDFTKAIEINPKEWNYFFYRAFCFNRLNSPKSAISDHDKVLAFLEEIKKQEGLTEHEEEMKASQYLFKGYAFLRLKLCDQALSNFATACSLGEDSACTKTCR